MIGTDDVGRHVAYIKGLERRSDRFEHWATQHMRVSGTYWALAALFALRPGLAGDWAAFDAEAPLARAAILDFVLGECMRPEGGFGGGAGHVAHLTHTLSAVQVLVLLGALDEPRFSAARTAAWVAGLQCRASGAFYGDDERVEQDTRFSYCALAALALLGRIADADADAALAHVWACRNADGGYGAVPGAESHAGQVFCCVGAFAVAERAGVVPAQAWRCPALAEWLAWRQLPCGGLNGRPEKREDVCYSWWVLSSLAMLGRAHWVDAGALAAFIAQCADPDGGFADRPGDVPDVFHTLFAVAGLSLLQPSLSASGTFLAPFDPVFCMPTALLPASVRPR